MAENYINVYTAKPDEPLWLKELLETHCIPYRIETRPLWTGWRRAPRYTEETYFYVPESSVGFVNSLIADFNSAENVIWDDNTLFPEGTENELPQITCANCGERYDMDYPKCPLCGTPSGL